MISGGPEDGFFHPPLPTGCEPFGIAQRHVTAKKFCTIQKGCLNFFRQERLCVI
jgi:hypothetical protein